MANHANGSDRYEYLYETDDVKRRCETTALYMIETGATVRQAAAKFGISKSTVHMEVTIGNGFCGGFAEGILG